MCVCVCVWERERGGHKKCLTCLWLFHLVLSRFKNKYQSIINSGYKWLYLALMDCGGGAPQVSCSLGQIDQIMRIISFSLQKMKNALILSVVNFMTYLKFKLWHRCSAENVSRLMLTESNQEISSFEDIFFFPEYYPYMLGLNWICWVLFKVVEWMSLVL